MFTPISPLYLNFYDPAHVCVVEDKVYSLATNDRKQLQMVVPEFDDDISKAPLYSAMTGGEWCYDCVAQHFAQWVCFKNYQQKKRKKKKHNFATAEQSTHNQVLTQLSR